MRIYQLHTTWNDGKDLGGTCFYFEIESHIQRGREIHLIKQAAIEYLMTDEGKKINKSYNGNLGWGDVLEIPNEILSKYGLQHHEGPEAHHSNSVEHDAPFL